MNDISIRARLHQLTKQTTSSIAFYPTIISLCWIMLALISLHIEQYGFSSYLKENLPFLVINNADTARTILSTFIGSILSLTVFSFSMVMIILNQAAARYSPRLLPGLTTDKSNQIVLGIYIGTILYCIVIMRNIQPDNEYYQLPGFAILLAIVSAILCIALFVYFIHKISLKLRIEEILSGISVKTINYIEDLKEIQDKYPHLDSVPELNNRIKIKDDRFGYFSKINKRVLINNWSKEKDIFIEVIPYRGAFILPNQEILSTNADGFNDLKDAPNDLIYLEDTPYQTPNFENGFQQVVEIIVKAMSPGINDPGTAIDAIDTLIVLLTKRLSLQDRWLDKKEEDQLDLYLIKNIKSFEDSLFEIMAPIRQYCKGDVILIIKLINMLTYLIRHPSCSDANRKITKKELKILVDDSLQALDSERDQEVIQKVLEGLSS